MYPHQRERLSAALAAHQVSALVAASAVNVAYLTGFTSARPLDAHAPALGVFAPGGTALVVPASALGAVAADGAEIDHVIAYGRAPLAFAGRRGEQDRRLQQWAEAAVAAPPDALAAALEAVGIRDGALGVDEGGLAAHAWQALAARLTTFRIVPGAAALGSARAVKSPWEIESLIRALGVAEEALNDVVQTLQPGVTEREAATAWDHAARRRGGVPGWTVVLFGARTALPFAAPSDRALRARELVRLDVACTLNGYWGTVARTAVMGEPDPSQQEAWDAVEAAQSAAVAAVRPGARGGAAVEAAEAAARSRTPSVPARVAAGGIGLEASEAPAVGAGAATLLEPGMVMTVEVAYGDVGWGGAQARDTLLVTSTEARMLNRAARGLVVLD